MFDNFKKLGQLKALKDSLEKEKIEIEKNGTKLIINDKMEVEQIELNSELNKEQQEQTIKDCFNEAVNKIQMIAIQKMMPM
jgi:hypothetical protein